MKTTRLVALAHMTLGEVEDQHRDGRVGQVEYEGFMRAWAMAGAAAWGYRAANGWTTPSDDPEVETLAAQLVSIIAPRCVELFEEMTDEAGKAA